MRRLNFWMVAWLVLFSTVSSGAVDFFIDYSSTPDAGAIQAHEISILSPEARLDVAPLQASGRKLYAYLSIVEVGPDAPYRAAVAAKGIPLLGRNELWKSDLADIASPDWTEFVIGELAAEIVQKKFDGFFLDTADSQELLAQKFPERAQAFREGLIRLIKGLKARFPERKIILNRGFQVWPDVRESVDGVLVESLYQTFDGASGQYRAVESSGTEWLVGHIRKIQAAGQPVYVVDYVDPQDAELARATAHRIEDLGCYPFVSTPALDGRALAPLREVPRRVLVLFGNQAPEAELRVRWPAESEFALTGQMPLEWLGYEVDYLNPSFDELPDLMSAQYAGVILESTLRIPLGRQNEMVDWIIRQKGAGQKVIFLKLLPVLEAEPRQRLLRAFQLGGQGSDVFPITDLSSPVVSSWMNYEAPVSLLPTRFKDLQAPPGADIHLSVRGRDEFGKVRTFDAVFTAPWGGVALEPYVHFQRPDFVSFWMVDPFAFFSAALGRGHWPAPDTTTRDGLRIFYTHIDADGFRHQSSVKKGQTSAEIILERVIEKYPVPFTCSVIEAEVRALIVDQKRDDEKPLTELARRILALPKVEAASHAFSHPYYWDEDDKQASFYAEQTLKLIPPWTPTPVDVEREVAGSVRFIEEHLLPPGKKVKIFLWSGNCRPYPEALRVADALGIENMNGGDTIISRRNPSITQVAPRVMPWGDELQIHASNQNENVYRDRWKPAGQSDLPFYGGYIHAVESFQKTERPRRLKPVNIYFHFYSGDNLMALSALTRTFDWAMAQPLHALTASQFAGLVRDCRRTRLFERSTNHWVMVNQGRSRTFRLSKNAVVPDIAASRGITGYVAASDYLYVHANGRSPVELALTRSPKPHLYVEASSGEIEFEALEPKSARFSVRDVRPVQVTLGGAAAGQKYAVRINEADSALTSDASGKLKLELPAEARVSVEEDRQ